MNATGDFDDRRIGWRCLSETSALPDDETVDHVDLAIAPLEMILQNTVTSPGADISDQLIEQFLQELVRAFHVFRPQTENRLNRISNILAYLQGLRPDPKNELAHTRKLCGIRER